VFFHKRYFIPGLEQLEQQTEFHVSETLVQNCPRAESQIAIDAEAKKEGFILVAEDRDCP
jgi:hypothetical protein